MTMISATRYEVEIQPPSSTPAPMAPWISASEALTIWMLSTAMKAPSVAPNTAIQVFKDTACGGTAGAAGFGAGLTRDRSPLRFDGVGSIVVWSAVMAVPFCDRGRMH